MRLAPKSLAGQLTLLLRLALAVAQGVAVALFAWERIEALCDAYRENAAARAATVVRPLRDTLGIGRATACGIAATMLDGRSSPCRSPANTPSEDPLKHRRFDGHGVIRCMTFGRG